MSTFVEVPITCPHCQRVTTRTIATSINGPRIPEVVGDIRDGTFQVFTCPGCHQRYEVDEALAFIDFDRGHWVTMYPAAWEHGWRGWEAEADRNYLDTMVNYAAPAAAELGEGLWRRTVFGLEALREKLAIAAHDLDDVAVEALKLDLMRSVSGLVLSPAARPRFVEIDGDTLLFRAMGAGDDPDTAESPAGRAVLGVERAQYDVVLGDAWQPTREKLAAGTYVDLGRLLLDGGDADAAITMLAGPRAAAVEDFGE
ncbi:MAG: CpXC domain-containing protein [Myxococcota bacterium]